MRSWGPSVCSLLLRHLHNLREGIACERMLIRPCRGWHWDGAAETWGAVLLFVCACECAKTAGCSVIPNLAVTFVNCLRASRFPIFFLSYTHLICLLHIKNEKEKRKPTIKSDSCEYFSDDSLPKNMAGSLPSSPWRP